MKSLTFKTKDIFIEDPENPDQTILKIPEEILKEQGWTEGTVLKIKIGDQGTIIIEEAKKGIDKSE